jgi:hypothetical protein
MTCPRKARIARDRLYLSVFFSALEIEQVSGSMRAGARKGLFDR